MGAQGSTPRTVHLDNDIPIGVIDVSDDVVQRLKGLNAQARNEEKERSRAVGEIPANQLPANPAGAAATSPTTSIVYYAEPTVTALEVRRQKELELRNNDLYWQRRLQQQELQFKQTSAILEKEYNETFNEVRKRFENAPNQHQLPPCKEFKVKLLECYKANVNQPLNCASVVSEFTNCVQDNRTKLLSDKQKRISPAPAVADGIAVAAAS